MSVVMDSDEMNQPLMNDLDENQNERSSLQWRDLWEEAKKQIVLALPMMIMNLLQMSLPMIALMFVGHLSELALSSTSVATSITNVTGVSIMMGMSCALETLCGQAFGAREYRSVGIHMQRGIVVLLCLSIPISILWFYMDHILLFLGQDPFIAFEAGKYAKYLIPTLYSYALIYPMEKFLQAQSIIIPMMLRSVITVCVHILVCWLLILKLGLGVEGAALANNISFFFNVILLAFYILFSPTCKKTRAPISREALHDINNFLSLGIPSAVMICFEWWAFEILILVSGLLPNPQLETSVLSICLNTVNIAATIPYSIGAASSIRVSNGLGGGDPETAKLALRAGLLLAIIDGLMRGILMLCMKNYWGRAFSNEEEVISYISLLMPILAIETVLDGIQGVMSGIARGSGQQTLCAYANLVSYYIVAIPSAIALGFLLHLAAMVGNPIFQSFLQFITALNLYPELIVIELSEVLDYFFIWPYAFIYPGTLDWSYLWDFLSSTSDFPNNYIYRLE